ncbi:lysostaphin resistance A-like protein [uncultured Sphingomonas sp.]|uniref:CPBP family intramembrane glutamic endopeptidase n=1 Tax=uncultured Sphingomonas sp. TaxID=158754 RepID=UPI0035CA0ADF
MQPSYPSTPADSIFWRIVHFPLVALVIGLIVTILPSTLFQAAVVRVFHLPRHGGDPLVALGMTVASVIILFLSYRGFNRWIERRGNVDLAHAGAVRELGAGVVAGLVLFSVVVGAIALLGGYHVAGHHAASVLLPVLTLSIGSGFSEELLFRGLIFRLLEQWLGSWAALAISAALFGAGHLANANSSWLAATAIALEAGIMLGALYMLTRRLWAAIGLHMAWNFAQGGIYGIPISGNATPGLLVDHPAGSALLTGGAFGAEASLPAIVIATGFGVALLAACVKHDRIVPFLPRRRSRGPHVTVL